METYLPTFSHFPVVSQVSTTGGNHDRDTQRRPREADTGGTLRGPSAGNGGHWRPRAQGQEFGTERDETQRGDNGKTQRGHGGFIV